MSRRKRRFAIFLSDQEYAMLEEMGIQFREHDKSSAFRVILKAAYIQFQAFRESHPDIPVWIIAEDDDGDNWKAGFLPEWYNPKRIDRLDKEWLERKTMWKERDENKSI